jgi:diguanylate cyclase (GGDEF)-like protein
MTTVLIREGDTPMESRTDRNLVLVGAAVACGGAVLGLSTMVVNMLALGIVALALAVAAGAITVVLGRRLVAIRGQVVGLESRVADLECNTPDREPSGMLHENASTNSTHGESVTDLDRPTADTDHRNAGEHLTDAATGLFSEGYFKVALDARLSAARRHLRPVAVVLMDVVDGLGDGLPRPTTPTAVAEGINETVRDADTACRMKDGRFGLVLEDTPENGAIWTIERIRRHLAERHPGQTVWAGVACYPAHAFDAEEILKQAEDALTAAREWRQDRIEVATAT